MEGRRGKKRGDRMKELPGLQGFGHRRVRDGWKTFYFTLIPFLGRKALLHHHLPKREGDKSTGSGSIRLRMPSATPGTLQ